MSRRPDTQKKQISSDLDQSNNKPREISKFIQLLSLFVFAVGSCSKKCPIFQNFYRVTTAQRAFVKTGSLWRSCIQSYPPLPALLAKQNDIDLENTLIGESEQIKYTTTSSSLFSETKMPKIEDPLIRDKKEVPLASLPVAFISFVLSLFIVTPLWLVVLLPTTIIWQLISAAIGLFIGKSKKKSPFTPEDPVALAEKVAKTSSDVKDRIYDLVLFGATGFTGKLAAAYLAKQYGTKVRWAIAGRRRDALEKVRNELIKINANLADLPIVIADSFDEEALNNLTQSTKVVITTAGPFSKYGTPLVKSCALHGTHYSDITGETDWVREMIDQFDDASKRSGARIVSFCGHDCIPWDLSVLKAAKFLKAKGETLSSIHFYDTITASASGGTLATMNHVLSNRIKYKSFLGFDPLLKTPLGEKSNNKLNVENQLTVTYSKEHESWTGPFVMSMVMANCVRRANAVNNYGSKLAYKEVQTFPNFFAAYTFVIGLFVFGTAFFLPPLHWILQTFVLPKPGEGPSVEFMDSSFLKVDGYAKGSNGTKVRTMIYFPTDPGYRDTARMLVESGLALALDGNKIKGSGGVFTPATCQGEVLLDRLIATGSSFDISEV